MCLVCVQFNYGLVERLVRPRINWRYLEQWGCRQAARTSRSSVPGIVLTM